MFFFFLITLWIKKKLRKPDQVSLIERSLFIVIVCNNFWFGKKLKRDRSDLTHAKACIKSWHTTRGTPLVKRANVELSFQTWADYEGIGRYKRILLTGHRWSVIFSTGRHLLFFWNGSFIILLFRGTFSWWLRNKGFYRRRMRLRGPCRGKGPVRLPWSFRRW